MYKMKVKLSKNITKKQHFGEKWNKIMHKMRQKQKINVNYNTKYTK